MVVAALKSSISRFRSPAAASAVQSLPVEPLEGRLMFAKHVLYVPTPTHVVILVEENQPYSNIIGNRQLPFINNLAGGGASFTNSFALAHPSQPNYLALFSGSTQGVTDDSPTGPYTRHNLGEELIGRGLSYATYAEGLPFDGYSGGDNGQYAVRHDPAADFTNVPSSSHLTFNEFPTTDAGFAAMPTVSLVVPNLGHDMHDGTPQAADQWAHSNIYKYAVWARTHNSLLIVTWDEDDNTNVNQVATIFYGSMVRPGTYSEQINHYNVLRTVLDMYHLSHPGFTGTIGAIRDSWVNPATAPAVAKATVASNPFGVTKVTPAHSSDDRIASLAALLD